MTEGLCVAELLPGDSTAGLVVPNVGLKAGHPNSCEQSVFQHNCSQRYSSLRAAAHSAQLFPHSDSVALETPEKHGLPYRAL